jgi:PAS domain S-box-containing protein
VTDGDEPTARRTPNEGGPAGEQRGRDIGDALAAIVESADDAIYSKDRDLTITSWNAAAQRLYGYSSEEAIGSAVSILIPTHRKGEEFDILQRVLTGERVAHYETERLRKDGTLVEVSVSVSPVHNSQGEIVEAAIIARDISERLRLQKEVEVARLNERALRRRQALELNDEVVQGLAVAKMALEGTRHREGLEAVSATLNRAQGIVSRLLEEHKK